MTHYVCSGRADALIGVTTGMFSNVTIATPHIFGAVSDLRANMLTLRLFSSTGPTPLHFDAERAVANTLTVNPRLTCDIDETSYRLHPNE